MKALKILCPALSPAIQRTLHLGPLHRGEVNRVKTLELSAAGKGVNVARVLKTLGGRPSLIGLAGGHSGRQLKSLLKSEGLSGRWIAFDGETRHAHTLLEGGQVTEVVEENPPVPLMVYNEFLTAYMTEVPKHAAIILAGSPPPGAPAGLYEKLLRKAGRIPVLLDAQKEPFTEALKARPAMVKCNREELGHSLGHKLGSQRALIEGMRALQRSGARAVMITDGAGKVLLLEEKGLWEMTPPALQALNPIGSGDACNAGLMLARLRGAEWPEACAFGMACGAANALTSRPGFLNPGAVTRLLKDVRISKK